MQYVGVHLDEPFLRICVRPKHSKGIRPFVFHTFHRNNPNDVKPLYTMLDKSYIRSSLSSKEIFIQTIILKLTTHHKLEETFLLHAEGLSHLNPNEVIRLPKLIKKEEEKTTVDLYTVSKLSIQKHLELLTPLRIIPDALSSQAIGLLNYIRYKLPHLNDGIIVYLGSTEWSATLMQQGRLQQSYASNEGIETLFKALWEDRKKVLLPKDIEGAARQIDLLSLKSNLNPNLARAVVEMKKEFTRIVLALSTGKSDIPIIFTGRFQAFGGLKDVLIEDVKKEVGKEIELPIGEEESKHVIAIGLSLEEAESSEFLQEEFFPQKIWRKSGLTLFCLALFSITFALSSFFLASHFLESKRKAMTQEIELAFVNVQTNKNQDLNSWLKLIREESKNYPYMVKAPLIAEVLSWIDQHPLCQFFKLENDPLEIISFQYQMVQYPTIDSPQDPYQAKIDLEFAIQNPIHARKFHDAITQDQTMVDPSSDIEWEVLDQSYRLSFFLKNKETAYGL